MVKEKTEMVIIERKRSLKNIIVELNCNEIRSKEHIEYLDVIISQNSNRRGQIKNVVSKADVTVQDLRRLLPNIGGPKTRKRRIIGWLIQYWYALLRFGR